MRLGRAYTVSLLVLVACLASPRTSAARDTTPPRLYFAMWTAHLRRSVVAFGNNWVIGVSGHGYYGATFLNSYGRRAFTGGIQRTLAATRRPHVNGLVGLRAGFITGYDGRLTKLARKTPVLPVAQPFAMLEVRRVGVEVSYTVVVVSAAVSYRF
jgi:hypothetical protein